MNMTTTVVAVHYAPHTVIGWPAAFAALQRSLHEGTRQGNTLIFTGTRIAIVLIANAPHHPDMSFAAGGLTNPALSVPRGSTVTMTLVNMDYGIGMAHGLTITTRAPPYPAVVAGRLRGVISSTGLIPPRTAASLRQARFARARITFTAGTPGTDYYVCPAPAHALAFHMYGRLIVRR
ncbi:MAG: cupredoxin domain-containing protein [Acidiferrobacter sp.]